MWKKVLAALCLVTVSPETGISQVSEVALRAVDSPLGERNGMTNIFFEAGSSVSVPPAWDSVGVAVLTRIAGREVRVARGWRDGAWEYRVDINGDGTVQDDGPLRFAEFKMLRAAAIDIHPETPGLPALRFHVLTVDGFVYGRPARSWRGEFQAGDRTVAVAVRAPSRDEPVPGAGASFEMLVDLDGNGALRERSELKPDGGVAPSELVRSDQPFRVGPRAYRLESVDVGSRRLRIRPVGDSVATAPGFLAPLLETSTLDGQPVSLQRHRGEVVVLEFWSTHCPFSEQIRPEITSLKARFGPGVRWITVARELEADTIRAHLADHPMAGEPWTNRADIWQTWNPRTVTPMFYVIGRDGRIVAVERGAGAAPALEAWLRRSVR